MITTLLDNKLYIALIVLAVALLGVYSLRLLSQKLKRKAQRATARASFGHTVRKVAAKIPPPTDYWENKILDDMPYVSKILNHAVLQLSAFLSSKERSKLENEWLSTKSFIEKNLSEDLFAAGLLYGSTAATARSTKQQFHNRIQSLLEYSDEI